MLSAVFSGSGTSAMLSSEVNNPVAHESTQYGLIWIMTVFELRRHFECVICAQALNVAAILFWGHPYIWRTTMILSLYWYRIA